MIRITDANILQHTYIFPWLTGFGGLEILLRIRNFHYESHVSKPNDGRGHGVTVVTHLSPTSEVGSSNLRPYVETLGVAYHWYVGIYGQCHKHYCFVTLTFNFKVIGGLQGQILVIFFTFWPSSHIQKVRSSYGWNI